MPHKKNAPVEEPSNNEFLQPFVIAALAAIFGSGYVYYDHRDAARALIVGAVVFIMLFWLVWSGNKRKKQRSENGTIQTTTTASAEPNRGVSWLKLAAACFAGLCGIALLLEWSFGTASDRQTTINPPGYETSPDDQVKRVRRIQFIFWQELSKNLHPSFEGGFDAALVALKIPIHDVEKNWPTGPTIITYEGTSADARRIFTAVRSTGLPATSYKVVE